MAFVLPEAPDTPMTRMFPDVDSAKAYFAARFCERTAGQWAEVPDDVPRSQTSTFAWLISQLD